METAIILGLIAAMVLAGLYLIYQGGLWLYELWVEKFTSDPNPANPEAPHEPTFKEYLKESFVKFLGIGKDVMVHVIKVLEPRQFKKTRQTLDSWHTLRGTTHTPPPSKQKRTPVSDPNAYRPGFLKDPRDGIWKPTHIVNKRQSRGSTNLDETVKRILKDIDGKTDEELWDTLNTIDRKEMDTAFHDRIWNTSNSSVSGATNIHDRLWDTNFKDDDCDTWDTKKSKWTRNPGPR